MGWSRIFFLKIMVKIFFTWRKLCMKTSKKLQSQETKKTELRHNIFKLYKITYKQKNLKSSQINKTNYYRAIRMKTGISSSVNKRTQQYFFKVLQEKISCQPQNSILDATTKSFNNESEIQDLFIYIESEFISIRFAL